MISTLKQRASHLINKFFNLLGFQFISLKIINNLYKIRNKYNENEDIYLYGRLLKLIEKFNINRSEIDQLLHLIKKNRVKGQSMQDVAALIINGFKRNGYFVEFGAADGITNSNTFLLEKEYEWRGILAEPNLIYFENLKKDRDVHITNNCVYNSSGNSLEFIESGQLSTLSEYVNSDFMNEQRLENISTKYLVNTITLHDLLKTYNAPSKIDFLSIDTEGSEYEVINVFPFNEYKFNFICIEHNLSNNRQKIFELLINNGYRRICVDLSGADDWYIRNENSQIER